MPLTDLLTTVSSRTYPRWGQRSVSPGRMDNDDTQSTCADCTTTDLTVELPPVEATVCAVNKEKTTKKPRRKANKDQADAVWKVCLPNCFHNGNNNKGNVVQCHLCQTWIHPECVGQNDSDIVGIWTCPTCRTLPVLVQQLLDRSSVLESMLVRLEESNRRLVALVGEQRKEMSELRDGTKSANAYSYADVVRAPGRYAAGRQQPRSRHRHLFIYLLNIFKQGRTYRRNHCFTMLPCTMKSRTM